MEKLHWKDIFNCRKVFPESFDKCQDIARSVGYRYMAFNGFVFHVNALSTFDYEGSVEDLLGN